MYAIDLGGKPKRCRLVYCTGLIDEESKKLYIQSMITIIVDNVYHKCMYAIDFE